MTARNLYRTLLMAICFILGLTTTALAEIVQFHQTYRIAPGTPVTVSNKNGSVTIHTGKQTAVEVVAEKQAGRGGDVTQVEIRVHAANRLTIETVYLSPNPRVTVNYTITLPAHARLEEVTSSNGALTINATSGDLFAETSNGAITMHAIAGAVTAHSSNAVIALTGIQGDVIAETSNGALDIREITGAVTAKTSNGAIYLGQVGEIRSAKTSNGEIRAEIHVLPEDATLKTSNGAITLVIAPNLQANLELRTSNGAIYVHDLPLVVSDASRTRLHGRLGQGGARLSAYTSNNEIDLSPL